jgi:geranylgeranyl diphosphate synthase, type I
LDLASIRKEVDDVLEGFLGDLDRARETRSLAEVLRDFIAAGGKRIRPLLCMLGWHAAGGSGDATAALRLAASLELFHASVLIHDDIIDDSPVRRGRPAAHRVLAGRGPAGSDRRFGTSAAILLGNLTLAWSGQLMWTAPVTDRQLRAVLPVLDHMRRDVNVGQYLDLLASGQPSGDLDGALAIVRYKTARYTVERPLQAGAALAGAEPEVLRACSDFGVPLGEAFQLRDDLLGVFGDPARTGKSVLGDLREGKHTPLMAVALRRATPAQRAALRDRVGNPGLDEADAAAVRSVLVATGAVAAVEQMIGERHASAVTALDGAPFCAEAAAALRTLADIAVRRTS